MRLRLEFGVFPRITGENARGMMRQNEGEKKKHNNCRKVKGASTGMLLPRLPGRAVETLQDLDPALGVPIFHYTPYNHTSTQTRPFLHATCFYSLCASDPFFRDQERDIAGFLHRNV